MAAGMCGCGCGRPTKVARQTDTKRGWVRGKPMRFLNGHGGIARAATSVTAEERYAEELLQRSKLIVEAVHDDGPDELLRQIDLALALEQPPGVDPAVALVTVLAAQINPDTTDEQRLGWVRAFASTTSGAAA